MLVFWVFLISMEAHSHEFYSLNLHYIELFLFTRIGLKGVVTASV